MREPSDMPSINRRLQPPRCVRPSPPYLRTQASCSSVVDRTRAAMPPPSHRTSHCTGAILTPARGAVAAATARDSHRRMPRWIRLLLIAAAALPGAALAQVYLCELDDGSRLYQSSAPPGAACARVQVRSVTLNEAMQSPDSGAAASTAPRGVTVAPVSAGPSRAARSSGDVAAHAAFPRVDIGVQRVRDDERRRVLSLELQAEEAQLQRWAAELQRASAPDVKRDLGERWHRSRENIASLKRELQMVR